MTTSIAPPVSSEQESIRSAPAPTPGARAELLRLQGWLDSRAAGPNPQLCRCGDGPSVVVDLGEGRCRRCSRRFLRERPEYELPDERQLDMFGTPQGEP